MSTCFVFFVVTVLGLIISDVCVLTTVAKYLTSLGRAGVEVRSRQWPSKNTAAVADAVSPEAVIAPSSFATDYCCGC